MVHIVSTAHTTIQVMSTTVHIVSTTRTSHVNYVTYYVNNNYKSCQLHIETMSTSIISHVNNNYNQMSTTLSSHVNNNSVIL